MAGGHPRCRTENHARYAAVSIMDISCTIHASERIDRCTSDCEVTAREIECYWSVRGVVCLPFVGYNWPIFFGRWQGTYGQDMKVPHQKSHYNNTIKIDRRFIHVLSMILAAESIPCCPCLDRQYLSCIPRLIRPLKIGLFRADFSSVLRKIGRW